MCNPLDPLTCPDPLTALRDGVTNAATGLVTRNLDTLLVAFNNQLQAGIKAMATLLAAWILVPSTQVCADGAGTGWMATCNAGTSPAAQVRSWMLPLTVLIAVVGIVWQGITMAITRKGEPLLQVMKGLGATALWGAVGIAGTQLALRAGDSYSYWILEQAIFGESLNPTETVGSAIANMTGGESYTAALVLILLNVPILFVTVAQIILMVFREGAVVILAGQLQLAAAGSFLRLTSGWLGKLTGWMLALIAYKPVAASVYGVAFALMGDGFRNLVMGLAVLVMALVAMPALLKFFNWTVGSLNSSSGGLWMLGTGLAAGVHAASALRGLGGHRAADHAAFLNQHLPPPAAPPTNPSPQSPPPQPNPPPPPPASPASSTAATGAPTTSTATAATSAATGAATGGATVAAAAVVQAARQAAQAAKRAAGATGDAMDGR